MSSTLEIDYKWVIDACNGFSIIVEPRAILADANQAYQRYRRQIEEPTGRTHALCSAHIQP